MNGMECLGCGSCSFVCPARRMLAPSIQEMRRKLLASDGGIFFYTPVGLEIGFNYNGVNNQFGWMTATIKDYEEYLKKM